MQLSSKKLLFLDIDGVLNSYAVNYGMKNWPVCCYDRNLCKNLDYVLNKAGAELVISSTWREDAGLWESMPAILRMWGIMHEPVGRTTSDILIMPRGPWEPDATWHARNRTAQIIEYVLAHQPNAWIAVDDIDLELNDENFVHTNPNHGFVRAKALEALEKLT
jgi:hypothetical protein